MIRKAWLTLWLVVATVGIGSAFFLADGATGDAVFAFVWLAWAPVGYLILLQSPGNRVGLAAMTVGVGVGLSLLLAWTATTLGATVMAAWFEILAKMLTPVPWLAVLWLILVFPSGAYAGSAERSVAAALVGYGSIVAIGFAANAGMTLTGLPNPLSVPDPVGIFAFAAGPGGFVPVAMLILAGVVLLGRRWRRSVGVERMQYRWLLFGTGAFILAIVGQPALQNHPAVQVVVWEVATPMIPICIMVAVTRYRLYEIDRIISRTIGYGVVIATLALVFVSTAVWLPTRFIEGDSAAIVAGSTLVVASLFNPLRRNVLRRVDGLFHRSRVDPDAVAQDLEARLRHEVDSHRVVASWAAVVARAVQPVSASVWMAVEPRDRHQTGGQREARGEWG